MSEGIRVDIPAAYVEYRDAARSWLKDNVPVSGIADSETEGGFAEHREWERRLHAAGYSGISWPSEYGGADGDLLHEAIFTEEYERAGGPKRIMRPILRFLGPTILAFGTDEQRARWLPRMLTAEDMWSQGFSEPEAGSDLAAVRTRATLTGDTYVVNGQKTWNTYGQFSDRLFALVRTGEAGARHRGLTCLAIDMDSPGIEVRPIRQVHGRAGFAEIFLTDVAVPADNRIGPVGEGWDVAMTMLSFERGTDTGGPARSRRRLDALAGDITRQLPDVPSDIARELGSASASALALRAFTYQQLTSQWQGEPAGFESSMIKLYSSELDMGLVDLGVSVFGDERLADDTPEFLDFWHSRASRIYGGTAEIQRNIVADRILGLSR